MAPLPEPTVVQSPPPLDRSVHQLGHFLRNIRRLSNADPTEFYLNVLLLLENTLSPALFLELYDNQVVSDALRGQQILQITNWSFSLKRQHPDEDGHQLCRILGICRPIQNANLCRRLF